MIYLGKDPVGISNTATPIDDNAGIGDTDKVWSADKSANELNNKISDVQVNATSIVQNGVANVPLANANRIGAVKLGVSGGLTTTNDGSMLIDYANADNIKLANTYYKPIVPAMQRRSVFYGLAASAGDTSQSASSNAVGTYTDEAKAKIQHMLGTDTNLAPYESDTTSDTQYAIGEVFMLNGKLHRATAAIEIGDMLIDGTNCEIVNVADIFTRDVQVNGVSVVTDGVANVPYASGTVPGVVKADSTRGVGMTSGFLTITPATPAMIKAGTDWYKPLGVRDINASTFYGLARAAGDSTQSASSNAVGAYTESAKSAISTMLNGSVSVSGTTPSITALPGIRYVCGEVATLDVTVPASGIVDVVFESGSTATVLTVTPPTGMTMKWTNGFDPDNLEANTTYEINIMDGCLGVAASWT